MKNLVLAAAALTLFLLPMRFAETSVLPVAASSSATAMPPLDGEAARKPFVLDLPELGITGITAAETIIPRFDLQTIRLRVLNPFAGMINYGKSYLHINGAAANTARQIKASSDGQIIICNLANRPDLQLHAGKNVIEIIAPDKNGVFYYASFILRTGKVGAKGSAAQNAVLESVAVTNGADREPPVIYLSEPKGAAQPGAVKVSGLVTDNSGALASLTINGVTTQLSAATQGRGISLEAVGNAAAKSFAFERTVTVNADATSLVIEAKDHAGNLARVLLPVRRREAAVSAQFSGRKYAVIIGISDYQFNTDGLTDLSYCDADARAMKDFLQQRSGGGFAASDILYFENQGATLDAVQTGLRSFLSKAGANDLVLIFLAAHGSPDPYAPQNLYFIMHDTKVANMESTALPMTELQNILDERVKAERTIVFIDTCHSAGLSGKQITRSRGLENNLINLYATKLFKETGRAILTSSDVSEESQESSRWGGGHGIFTFALLEGLRGEADTNKDRYVTAGEIFSYVRNRVSVETGFKQNPTALPGLNKDLTLSVATSK